MRAAIVEGREGLTASTAALDLGEPSNAGRRASAGAVLSASGAYRATRLAVGTGIGVYNRMAKPAAGCSKVQRSSARKVARRLAASLAFVLLICVMAAPLRAADEPELRREVRNLPVKRGAVANLQKWVNEGNDGWCKDPRSVASATLRRTTPEFSDEALDLAAFPLQPELSSQTRIVLVWTLPDGSASYRVTLRRFAWQRTMVKNLNDEVWVPVKVEIIRVERPLQPDVPFPESSRA